LTGQLFEDQESAGLALAAIHLRGAHKFVVAQAIGTKVCLWGCETAAEGEAIVDKQAEELLPEQTPFPTVIIDLSVDNPTLEWLE